MIIIMPLLVQKNKIKKIKNNNNNYNNNNNINNNNSNKRVIHETTNSLKAMVSKKMFMF